mgnify:CR=1 FL=1
MQVEQITYGSVKRRRMKGYQIVGKSPGIDATMSSAFCRWAPSHNSIEAGSVQPVEDAWGLSYFPLSEFHHAVARSVHGGPEYSGRGGFAVVTSALVMTRSQLSAYEFHAIDIARTAITLGQLILQIEQDETLPTVELTTRPLSLPLPQSDFSDSTPPQLTTDAVDWIAEETVRRFRESRKVMIVGKCDPLPILALIFDQLTPNERHDASFACGLKPSNRRDFRIQFTRESMSHKLQKELDRAGIDAIDISKELVETT